MNGRRITFLEAEARLGGTFLHPRGRPATDLLLDFIAPEAGDTILEIGCGLGTTTALIAKHSGVSVVMVDASTAMLCTARKRINELVSLAVCSSFGMTSGIHCRYRMRHLTLSTPNLSSRSWSRNPSCGKWPGCCAPAGS